MKKRCRNLVTLLAVATAVATLPLAAADAPKPPEAQRLPLAPTVYASPVNAGCYIAAPGQCKIHVDPFTINIASGTKLVLFRLVAILSGSFAQRVIYDFRPDQSNPPPSSGTTFTPSLVTQDFAATCGNSYEVALQGQDSGDTTLYNLGLTGFFTCPSTSP